jgi:hypothetical protein
MANNAQVIYVVVDRGSICVLKTKWSCGIRHGLDHETGRLNSQCYGEFHVMLGLDLVERRFPVSVEWFVRLKKSRLSRFVRRLNAA